MVRWGRRPSRELETASIRLGAQKAVDGVVEGAAFEDQDFVLVAFVKEGLHLVGMHGLFAQEGEDGDFPDTEIVGHGCPI